MWTPYRRPKPQAILRLLALSTFVGLGFGCGSAASEISRTIDRFAAAVQNEDLAQLYCLVSGIAGNPEYGADEAQRRSRFEAWVRERFLDYESGRDLGSVPLDARGIVLVKLFALGRGTFARHGPTAQSALGRATVDSELRFAYRHVDLSPLPPGTILYLAARPIGNVRAVRIPAAGVLETESLETVRLGWTMVRVEAADSCPGGWVVERASPIPDSETTTIVRWTFR